MTDGDQFRITPLGTEAARQRRTMLSATLRGTGLTLRTMVAEPSRLWTSRELAETINPNSSIFDADVAFFGKRLAELERKGLVERI